MSRRVLVTGGAGFVGSHTVDALLKRGHSVTIFDNLTPQVHGPASPSYLADEAEFLSGDIRDADAVRRALHRQDVVIHLASSVGVGQSMYEIAPYMSVNTQGTAVLLQAILDGGHQVEKLVVASSMSIYGEGQYRCPRCGPVAPPPRSTSQLRAHVWEMQCPHCAAKVDPAPTSESKPLQCTSYYALSKRNQEEMALLFGRTYAMPVVALRYFNIYGTRQSLSNPYTGVAAIFASRLLNRRAPLVFEDGLQMRDFVSVRDVVAANLLALEHSHADGMALNIGSGRPVSIHDVALALARELNIELAPEITAQYRAGDIRHCFADIAQARSLLGYAPAIEFESGMRELAQWLASQSAEDRVAEAAQQLHAYGLTA